MPEKAHSVNVYEGASERGRQLWSSLSEDCALIEIHVVQRVELSVMAHGSLETWRSYSSPEDGRQYNASSGEKIPSVLDFTRTGIRWYRDALE